MLIDLHTHTYPKSADSSISPAQLVIEAKRVGLDGICLTDHDGFWDARSLQGLGREHDLLIFPGCEVTTEEGHLLVFGLNRYIFGMHRASYVRGLVDRAGGVIIVAHPYRRSFREEEANTAKAAYLSMVERACRNSIFSVADCVEVLNGRGSDGENAFSLEISKRFGLKGTGGSDAHRVEELGTFATEFPGSVKTLAQLIHAFKEGRFEPVTLERHQNSAIVRR